MLRDFVQLIFSFKGKRHWTKFQTEYIFLVVKALQKFWVNRTDELANKILTRYTED